MDDDRNVPSFGIRPVLYEGESLSSYLHRIATLNRLSYRDILKIICRNHKTSINKKLFSDQVSCRIDLLPDVNYDVSILSKLIKRDKSEIFKHTLSNIYVNYNNYGFKVGENIKRFTNNIYNTENRYFCPECIKIKKGVYKLHWQVNGVEICELHNCKLETLCLNCNVEQSYIHKGLGEGLCSNCSKILRGKVTNIYSIKEQSKSTEIKEDFYYWLNSSLNPYPKINNIDTNSSIIIFLLNAVQMVNERKSKLFFFKPDSITSVIDRATFSRMVGSLTGRKEFRISFQLLVKYLYKINISYKRFTNIDISKKYLNSINIYIKKRDMFYIKPIKKPFCKCKICPSLNNDRLMLKQNRKTITFNKVIYSSTYICMGCFMQYGYNPHNKNWENISDVISIYDEVCSLLNKNIKAKEISKIYSFSLNKVYRIIAYSLDRGILNKEVIDRYKAKITTFNEIKYIYNELDIKRKGTKLIKEYKIHPINFYYYFYTEEIQLKIFVNSRNSKKNTTYNQLQEYIESCLSSEINISFKEFHRLYQVERREMIILGLYEELKCAINTQKKEKRKRREKALLEQVSEFYTKNNKQTISINELVNFLGISAGCIRRTYPVVYKKCIEVSKQSKNDFFNGKIVNAKKELEQIVLKKWNSEKIFPTINEISKVLGFGSHIYSTYREVYEYYLELKTYYSQNN